MINVLAHNVTQKITRLEAWKRFVNIKPNFNKVSEGHFGNFNLFAMEFVWPAKAVVPDKHFKVNYVACYKRPATKHLETCAATCKHWSKLYMETIHPVLPSHVQTKD